MSRRIARLLVTTMAVGFIVVGSGCATDDQIFKLRLEVKEAKGAADRAERAANEADSAANASVRLSTNGRMIDQGARECPRRRTRRGSGIGTATSRPSPIPR